MNGKVVYIFVARQAGDPMLAMAEVVAMADIGLEGDRYASDKGSWSKSKKPVKRHVSLIEQEVIDRIGTLSPQDTRRNIVVRNFPLNGLIGKEFIVGHTRMLGVELCDPCQRPSKLSGKPGFETDFKNYGGLRAEILSNGIIKIDDEIYLIP